MVSSGLKLGVNIDHVATLRQARGTAYPDTLEAARLCERAGAHGITVHLREDRRHIQERDVRALKANLSTRLNLEMANVDEIVGIAIDVCPDEVCLVPERREELTTEGGLNVAGQRSELAGTVAQLGRAGICVSLFIEPDRDQLAAARDIGAPYVELHTGTFCDATGEAAARELARLVAGAEIAHGFGLRVNAGHGISIHNIESVLQLPHLDTLNIGHSIVSRSVFIGIGAAVAEVLGHMATYPLQPGGGE